MIYKMLFIIFILFTTASFAETCPPVADIRNGVLHGWQPVGLESGEPASEADMTRFKKAVKQFALAEWMREAPEGVAHCYYRGKRDEDYLRVYLAKANLIAQGGTWYAVGEHIKQCQGSLEGCFFQP